MDLFLKIPAEILMYYRGNLFSPPAYLSPQVLFKETLDNFLGWIGDNLRGADFCLHLGQNSGQ